MNIYDFTVVDNKGVEVSLGKYEGKALLIVNTATKCGHTKQYAGLEELYKKYADKGFEILDFPCNQFMMQAPGTDAEIDEFCTLNFGTTFPRFAKINVNGKEAIPLFAHLRKQTAGWGDAPKTGRIKWNFTKFLIDREGNIVARFEPAVLPEEIAEHVETLL